MKQFNIEDLSIESITLTDASIENPDSISAKENDAYAIKYGIAFEKFLNIKDGLILINLNISLICLDKEERELNIKGNFTTRFVFKVKGLSEYVEKDQKSKIVNLEQQLSISALNMVYSTSRGIIYTRCLGTVLGTIILPIISSQQLLTISDAPTTNPKGKDIATKKAKKGPSKRTKNIAKKK